MNSNARRRLVGGSVGNVGELFDFSIYGLSAPALAAHFFPAGSSTAATISTFGVYAVSFAARPFGGVLFGFLGDRRGRIRTLTVTVLLMGGGTMVTGLLPSYSAVGIGAPLLLVVCRLAQGLSFGGETTGSYSYVAESAPDGKRGRWIGVSACFVYVPTAAAALVVLAVHRGLGDSAYLDWGWRLPFLLGGAVAVVGLWLRLRLDDPEEYRQARAAQPEALARNPLRAMAQAPRAKLLKSMALVVLLEAPWGVGAYLLTGYMYAYLVEVAGLGATAALLSNACAALVLALMLPFLGALSDRVGRRVMLAAGSLWLFATAYPSFKLAGSGTILGAFTGQLLLAAGLGLYVSAVAVTFVELFPTRIRYTSHGLITNIAVAIFGGATPLIASSLVSGFHSSVAPAVYSMVLIGVFGFAGVLLVPETSRVSLRTSVIDEDLETAEPAIADDNGRREQHTLADSLDYPDFVSKAPNAARHHAR